MGVPQVVIYKVHPATWRIGRRLARTRWISLPNNLAQRSVVPEVLQELDAAVICSHALALAGPLGDAQVSDLEPVVAGLCDPLGADRAARLIRRIGGR